MGQIYWVEASVGRLAVLARPRGGDGLPHEVGAWKDQGLHFVVSLLTDEEERDLGLGSERSCVEAVGMAFISYPIDDGGTPASTHEARDLIDRLVGFLRAGLAVGIHCRAGIGRSPMMVAAVLTTAGVSLRSALRDLCHARGVPVPETEEQLAWLQEFAGTS
jgi:protein-tyrosine phosphatase